MKSHSGIAYPVICFRTFKSLLRLKIRINKSHRAHIHSGYNHGGNREVNIQGTLAVSQFTCHCAHLSQAPLNSALVTEWQCLSRLPMCVIEVIEN